MLPENACAFIPRQCRNSEVTGWDNVHIAAIPISKVRDVQAAEGRTIGFQHVNATGNPTGQFEGGSGKAVLWVKSGFSESLCGNLVSIRS
ncbi:MAG: hypothetical protein WCS37_21240 [Chloroflexota bacterium]